MRTASFVTDGDAVWLDDAGLSHFDRLHSRKHQDEVRLVAFDLLAINGGDIRAEPLHVRKDRLARLLAKAGDAIQVNPHMEATSAQRCSSTPANSGLKESCQSAGIALIAPGGAHTGSRSRTRTRRRSGGVLEDGAW